MLLWIKRLSRWAKGALAAEGLNALAQALGFGNPLGSLVQWASAAAVLVMGWLAAHYAWAEGTITEWGTLGYVAVILGVALGVAMLFAIISWSYRVLWPIKAASTIHESADKSGYIADESAPETEIDEDALDGLTLFAIDYVLPLAYAHFQLQFALISKMVPDAMPASLAIGNLMTNHNTRAFGEHYDALSTHFSSSPMGRMPFKELKERIFLMDKNFGRLTRQTDDLADAANIDYRADEKLSLLWNEIRSRHNALVAEYKKIKRDRRFGPELYRPGINGPWTREIGDGVQR